MKSCSVCQKENKKKNKKGSLLFKQCPVNSIIQQRAMVRQAREISQAKEERRNGTLKYETFRWGNTAEHNATKC